MGLHKSYILPATVIGVSGLLALWGDAGRVRLRFDRAAIGDGEIWRLVSGHFVHLGTTHLVLNAAGLALVWYLFGRDMRPAQWLLVMVVSIAGIGAGFWVFEPQLAWYVGLSGVLHGMIAAGIAASMSRVRTDAILLAVILAAKLAYEQVAGPLPGSEDSAGGPVIVNAHLYGALAGALAGAIIRGRDGRQQQGDVS